MFTVLTILIVFAAILLTIVVLLQNGKGQQFHISKPDSWCKADR